ncbi:Crp/Fnr family transcriptional regulator [Flavobacterium sp. F-380]|uniref:Crp/Fnr family transcriptional regulator n=1 Tax=Flavobacterium kayseriense TaxID=2764714 RepID=A0ABR7J2Q7_9FLAO|nr:Crp/Fnr family transcriptional regulator [Flavobacterium kayseriense]MBC5839839.1 Crp/Fnr family transcriptional regulator [Flavobacterium kayseriense]MBC5847491.1 Crp/Fnr family transcriptional regulator [Flavobacterium kayseriense]
MTVYSQINKNISRYVSFEKEELEIFNSLLEHKKTVKKTTLLRAGEQCSFEAFLIKGSARKYYIDANGAEVILQLAVEDAWLSDISFSMYEDSPSNVFIETLEDCEFFIFSPESKESLFKKAPRFERAYRILMERHLAVTQNRLFETIAKTATDKYVAFLEQYPEHANRFAQHYIASYLGISPEFLSKIRNKLARL